MDQNQIQLKELIKRAKSQINALEIELGKLLKFHKHSMIKKHNSAVCEICELDFGWWCPDSPDHACHYHSEYVEKDGAIYRIVVLLDGAKDESFLDKDVPEKEHETEDCCLYCGEPEERK